MSALWTSKEAETATGGKVLHEWQASGVSIDSRETAPGDLFIALTDQRDGHDFVAAAFAAGASAAMVSRVPDNVAKDAPLLIVPDVLEALRDLAKAARARTKAHVVAVTGSAGKTSTKEMLRSVLSRQGQTHAAERSFNNHWGVPLTLARMPADTQFAIIEIGMNHPGEIAPLAKLTRPDVAMITTVAPAHLEAFDDLAGIAQEKASIVQGLTEPDGIQIVCADVPDEAYSVLDTQMNAALPRYWYGRKKENPWHLIAVKQLPECSIIRAQLFGHGEVIFKLAAPGRHFALNALGVLAAVEALGANPIVAAHDLIRWEPPEGRGKRETIVLDVVEDDQTFDVYDDAFNANPASVEAALDVLAASKPVDGRGRVSRGRRIAILGDMLELGPDEMELHRAIAKLRSLRKVDVVHCVGSRMRHLYDTLPKLQRGRWFETAQEATAHAHSLIDAGDVVLVKGSKGSKVSLVVDALRKLGHPLIRDEQGD
jgi:UDP-N-acetylmuramoyl-tripeptide--D-alanyl-D-alanine ligase